MATKKASTKSLADVTKDLKVKPEVEITPQEVENYRELLNVQSMEFDLDDRINRHEYEKAYQDFETKNRPVHLILDAIRTLTPLCGSPSVALAQFGLECPAAGSVESAASAKLVELIGQLQIKGE